ncbi:AraC family transcriptional regulator [Candidatus Pantoea deserta]|uniref:Arabinose operon regulatory protein n=1 Tax=Candidatus Pantoea deserta TaxID=1869313 RepID=A0A3N4PYX2_9GAMM|nr:AraC family transcriptional regulator [Pantoea deserta]RPE04694.1 AraC family transcriptional regulator [Pantoea deserta]
MAITAYRKIGGVEITFSDSTAHVFPRHSHDEFYIGANLSGREKIWLDGHSTEASIDDITIYNPGQVQAATPTPYNWLYYSFYLQPTLVCELTGLPADERFRRSVFNAPEIARQIRQTAAFSLSREHSDNDVMERIAGLLAEVASQAGTQTKCLFGHKDVVLAAAIASQLMEEMATPPALETLALRYGLTPVQLVRVFSAAYGMPPYTWLRGEKLKIAKQRILNGQPISSLAADLGFSDQAHFTRNFKNMFGITPGVLSRLVK